MDMDKDTVASATYGLCATFTVAATESAFGSGTSFVAAGILGFFAKDILDSFGYKDKTVPFLAGLVLGFVILSGAQSLSPTQDVDNPQGGSSATQERQITPPAP